MGELIRSIPPYVTVKGWICSNTPDLWTPKYELRDLVPLSGKRGRIPIYNNIIITSYIKFCASHIKQSSCVARWRLGDHIVGVCVISISVITEAEPEPLLSYAVAHCSLFS